MTLQLMKYAFIMAIFFLVLAYYLWQNANGNSFQVVEVFSKCGIIKEVSLFVLIK